MADRETPRLHEPVLLSEVLEYLAIKPDHVVVDATMGFLGHGEAIQERLDERGVYVGIDWDMASLEYARGLSRKTLARVEYVHGNFARLDAQIRDLGIRSPDRILFDLGVGSPSFDSPDKGLGIKHDDALLDFRLSDEADETAASFLNRAPETEIADVLWRYGDERKSRAIARAIVRERERKPFRIMSDFTEVIHRVYRSKRTGKVDSATKSAMAIRVYINREVENLTLGLDAALRVLAPLGRMLVISFHGLEDGIVKRFFRKASGRCVCPEGRPVCTCNPKVLGRALTKKPVWATPEEIKRNPRSRSARLRVFEKTGLEQP
jgi:16S rRNA (cytosine1402-N4)-methyltransferase